MTSDMNAIMVGYLGMRDMLDSIYGKAEPAAEAPPPPKPKPVPPPPAVVPVINTPVDKLLPLTPEAFDRMFGGPTGKLN